jgi:hypothetical protein
MEKRLLVPDETEEADFRRGSSSPAGERCAAHRLRFFAGVVLIALSFLVYPGYSLFVFLPLAGEVKLAGIIAGSFLSWIIFGFGTFLAGREGYEWLTGLWGRCRLR